MTFYEAAIEVLLKAGRPLHYKKITEAAIQENLLSHVGKTPEVTMGERLNQEIKKQEDSPVVSVRPGVFMLREEFLQRLQEEAQLRPRRELRPIVESAPSTSSSALLLDADAQAPLPESGQGGGGGRRRRRRSSRSGRGGNGRGDNGRDESAGEQPGAQAAAPAAVAAVETESAPSESAREPRESGRRRGGEGRGGEGRGGEGRAQGQQQQQQGRGRESGAAATSSDAPVEQKHLSQGPLRLDGIAEAATTVLKDSNQAAFKVKELADEIFKRKLVRFHTHDAATTVQAALANDNHMREQSGHRPLFVQYDRERWGLSEWGLSSQGVRKEQQMLSLAEEIRQDALSHLGSALLKTKPEALEHLALTLLERLGYKNIKVSKRSAEGDVFFTGDWRQGLSEIRVCIEVVGDAKVELSAETVTELRSTLHHYSASEGVIIHLGSISQAAIKESREERLAPITLIDRTTFVDLLTRHGIGVKSYQVSIALVDMAFIDDLSE
ncbi:MAG: restriction endonuclease [Bradymonadaceae bacterium]|nr:restriction endonuclease [Lujinxingiaceae bacterium]